MGSGGAWVCLRPSTRRWAQGLDGTGYVGVKYLAAEEEDGVARNAGRVARSGRAGCSRKAVKKAWKVLAQRGIVAGDEQGVAEQVLAALPRG